MCYWTHSIGDSGEMIKGAADIMIAGGSEAAVCKLGIAGFCAAKFSTSYNDNPEKASDLGIKIEMVL